MLAPLFAPGVYSICSVNLRGAGATEEDALLLWMLVVYKCILHKVGDAHIYSTHTYFEGKSQVVCWRCL